MYKKILVGFDGSEGSKVALHHAAKLANLSGAELWSLWVRGSLPHYPESVDEVEEERESANSFLQNLTRLIVHFSQEYGVEIHGDAKSGNPAKTIVDYAKQHNFDLLVLGHRGHSGLWGGFLGHITDKVSENAHCSVLFVR